PAADAWTAVAPFPLPVRKNSTAFTIGSTAYLVGGNGQSPILNEVWSFSPDTITTGVLLITTAAFAVHPNPVQKVLRIDASTAGNYRLLSSTGALIRHGSLRDGNISVGDLAPGIYILEIVSNDGLRRAR